LDSVGIGEAPDAADFGDVGSHTVYAASKDADFYMPNMQKLGFFHIEGNKVHQQHRWCDTSITPTGAYMRMQEQSKGKDTTIGHWEIAGLISPHAMPTFPQGFPRDLTEALERETGHKILCNMPYSGTEVIKKYGRQHMETGDLIVYTSADSVLQIAAHEDVIPVDELYRYCEIARRLCQGPYAVGRIIARPFIGTPDHFTRTANRHDFSLTPPKATMLDAIRDAGQNVIAVGKINDIFAGQGVTEMTRTKDNQDGINQTLSIMERDFEGLCFINLVDFDMKYGHRNDIPGYAAALSYFDKRLPELLERLRPEDILMITADHGCDPSTPSTDHSREYTPLVIAGDSIQPNTNLGTRSTFADIGTTICDYLQAPCLLDGTSFLQDITV
jgi:phosphopentomutase